MSNLLDVEAAAEALPPEQKEELFRFLAAHLRVLDPQPRMVRLVREVTTHFSKRRPACPL